MALYTIMSMTSNISMWRHLRQWMWSQTGFITLPLKTRLHFYLKHTGIFFMPKAVILEPLWMNSYLAEQLWGNVWDLVMVPLISCVLSKMTLFPNINVIRSVYRFPTWFACCDLPIYNQALTYFHIVKSRQIPWDGKKGQSENFFHRFLIIC